jgi:hypothetical protein
MSYYFLTCRTDRGEHKWGHEKCHPREATQRENYVYKALVICEASTFDTYNNWCVYISFSWNDAQILKLLIGFLSSGILPPGPHSLTR